MKNITAIVLAAGRGTRMNSDTPKVLHEVLGKPIILYVLEALKKAGVKDIVVVAGYKSDLTRTILWWVGVVFTAGLSTLLAYWRPDWELRVRCVQSSLQDCEKILITRDDEHQYVEDVKQEQVCGLSLDVRLFRGLF